MIYTMMDLRLDNVLSSYRNDSLPVSKLSTRTPWKQRFTKSLGGCARSEHLFLIYITMDAE